MSRTAKADDDGTLRRLYGYTEIFDVGLAAAFDTAEARAKFPFYEEIGRTIERLGKRVFLPHKEIGEDWEPRRVYDIVNRIVIPSLDLVLFYGGLANADAGMMVQRATTAGVPVICFYELSRRDHAATLSRDLTTCVDTIIFEDEARGIERLREAVEKFYRTQI